MLVESICIILIIAILMFIFLRSGRKEYAILATPLLLLPGIHTLANIVNELISSTVFTTALIISDIFGTALAAVSFGIASVINIKSKKSRFAYLVVCGGFTFVLEIIFLLNYLK